jgi:hypothetical protein
MKLINLKKEVQHGQKYVMQEAENKQGVVTLKAGCKLNHTKILTYNDAGEISDQGIGLCPLPGSQY